jgi:hypothetical protein
VSVALQMSAVSQMVVPTVPDANASWEEIERFMQECYDQLNVIVREMALLYPSQPTPEFNLCDYSDENPNTTLDVEAGWDQYPNTIFDAEAVVDGPFSDWDQYPGTTFVDGPLSGWDQPQYNRGSGMNPDAMPQELPEEPPLLDSVALCEPGLRERRKNRRRAKQYGIVCSCCLMLLDSPFFSLNQLGRNPLNVRCRQCVSAFGSR